MPNLAKSRDLIIKVAIMSDLHCHPKDGADPHSVVKGWDSVLHTDALRTDGNLHPIVALQSLIKKDKLRAHILVSPGDLTNKVHHQGLLSGWQYVKEIADSLKVHTLAGTLGNHDIDSRGEQGKGLFHLARGIGKGFPIPSGPASNSFYSNGFCFIEGKKWRLLVFNSVLEHHNEHKAKRGECTLHQLNLLKSELKTLPNKPLQFAIIHHHPVHHADLGMLESDVMVGGNELLQLLCDFQFDMLIHGHKHHPKLQYFDRGASNLLIFASGAFAAVDRRGLLTAVTRNLFHIVEFSVGKQCGIIKSWEWNGNKGWNPSTTTSADFPHKCGFGCVEPIDQLVDSINSLLGKRMRMTWDETLVKLPQLQYLTGKDLRLLKDLLEKKKAIQLAPTELDIPHTIGKLFTPKGKAHGHQ